MEELTRESEENLLITDATRARLGGGEPQLEEQPPVSLKGKRAAVRLWAPRRRELPRHDPGDPADVPLRPQELGVLASAPWRPTPAPSSTAEG